MIIKTSKGKIEIMRKKIEIARMVVLSTLLSATTMASAENNGIAVAAKVGTLGVGIELIKEVIPNITLRGGFNYLSLSRSASLSDVDYDANVDLQTLSLFADWHPNNSNFFLSAGTLMNGYEVTAKGTQTGNITVGNNSFTGNAQFDSKVKFDKSTPYLGVGYRKKLKTKGLSWTAEAGVLFQNEFEVELDVDAPIAVGITQNDVDVERQQIINDVEDLKYLPMVSVGITYQY